MIDIRKWLLGDYVSETIESFERNPDDWQVESHEIINKRKGVKVWTANGAYGMSIHLNGAIVWGGVNMASSLGLSFRHRALRRAADKLISGNFTRKIRS